MAAAAVCVLMFGAGGIYAYQTSQERAVNDFSVGNNSIEPKEEFDPPEELTEGENIYKKAVAISNTGNIPCYIRVRAEFSDSAIAEISGFTDDTSKNGTYYSALKDGADADVTDPDGNTVIYADSYTGHLPEGWVYIPETESEELGGYYYFTEEVEPGEDTSYLFQYVKTYFANAADVKAYDIYIYAESVQVRDHNGETYPDADPWKQAWSEFLAGK